MSGFDLSNLPLYEKYGPIGTIKNENISISCSPTGITFVLTGDTSQLTIVNQSNVDLTTDCNFSSSNESVATVSETGLVQCELTTGSGTTTITITFEEIGDDTLTTTCSVIVNIPEPEEPEEPEPEFPDYYIYGGIAATGATTTGNTLYFFDFQTDGGGDFIFYPSTSVGSWSFNYNGAYELMLVKISGSSAYDDYVTIYDDEGRKIYFYNPNPGEVFIDAFESDGVTNAPNFSIGYLEFEFYEPT